MPLGDHDPHRHTGSTPLQLQDLTHPSVCSTNGRRKSGFHITQTTKYVNSSKLNIIINILSLVTKPPKNLTATRTSDATATVNWSSPESGPTNLHYSVFKKSSDGSPILQLKHDAATTIQLTGLNPLIEYEIIVVATNPVSSTALPSYPRSTKVSMQGKLQNVFRRNSVTAGCNTFC